MLIEKVLVRDATRCVEDAVFEIVRTCNLSEIVVAENGVIKLPPRLAGSPLSEYVCGGDCLVVEDGSKTYVLRFRVLSKMSLSELAKLVEAACAKWR